MFLHRNFCTRALCKLEDKVHRRSQCINDRTLKFRNILFCMALCRRAQSISWCIWCARTWSCTAQCICCKVLRTFGCRNNGSMRSGTSGHKEDKYCCICFCTHGCTRALANMPSGKNHGTACQNTCCSCQRTGGRITARLCTSACTAPTPLFDGTQA